MLAVSEVSREVASDAATRQTQIIDETKRLFEEDKEFEEAVRLGTNTPARLRNRVNTMIRVLERIGSQR